LKTEAVRDTTCRSPSLYRHYFNSRIIIIKFTYIRCVYHVLFMTNMLQRCRNHQKGNLQEY